MPHQRKKHATPDNRHAGTPGRRDASVSTGSGVCTWGDFLWPYPLGGGYPQAVLVRAEAAGPADLGNVVDVLLVLGRPAPEPLELSVEVEEAAGEDKVAARKRRPDVNNDTNEELAQAHVLYLNRTICSGNVDIPWEEMGLFSFFIQYMWIYIVM